MADKYNDKTKKYDEQHSKRLASIERKIKAAYKKAAEDASKLATAPHLSSKKMYKLDDYPQAKKQADKILEELQQSVETIIVNGIESEWTLANNKNNELSQLVFGDNVGKLPEEQYQRYFSNNHEALQAFIARKQAGLNLSDRVWKYTGAFKDEIETAIDLGIRSGKSAAEISRDVRSYLQNPDKLFRRVKDEYGKLHLSKAAKAYHPGTGVYRSSYMNARRLAVTETNIAYRTADYIRQQQLDFIVGIRIVLSNNHNCKGVPAGMFFDICDSLQGNYPKDFKFTGWHPHCRCHVETILKTPEELEKDTERILAGRQTTNTSKNKIKDVPKAFKEWVKDNEDRILAAGDKLPYFLRDNQQTYQRILGIQPEIPIAPTATTLEKAAIRHAARTPEQQKAIIDAWNKRKQQYAAIEKEGKQMDALFKDISDVDTKTLEKALKKYDLKTVQAEIAKLKKTKLELEGLTKLDDPFKVAREFSFADAKSVNKAVVDRMSREHFSSLAGEKSWLEHEISWVETHKKYKTWTAARDAYKKELAFVQRKLDVKELAESVDDALAYSKASRSKPMRDLAEEMRAMLSDPNVDLAAAKKKAAELNAKYKQLNKVKEPKTAKSQGIKHETIEDLKKRMGDAFPKTLPNLEKAIAKYEKGEWYGDKAKKYKKEIEELMAKVFDTHDFGMNIDDDILEAVLNSWFKNTFETGSSGGYCGSSRTTGKIPTSHGRLSTAHNLFGLGKSLSRDQLARHDYEKYGNLLDHNILESMRHNTATQYGNVEVRFKKDKVTCTWTAGDSLCEKYQPSLVSDPRSCSFDDLYKTPTTAKKDVTDLAQFKRDHISSYLELQYHGELTIDCVESLTFPYNLKTSHYKDVALKWKAKGVKVYYIDNDRLYEF